MSSQPSEALDWLIIGGGIHGVHMAARLIGEGKVPPQRLRIVDPAETLLARWRACTDVTGMKYLRSPSVHHLDLEPFALKKFAAQRTTQARRPFAAPYDRPALDLFNAHCDSVIDRYGLRDLAIRGTAQRCSIEDDAVIVTMGSGDELAARRVVLAIGANAPLWPDWAPAGHPRVSHVFAPDFTDWPNAEAQAIAVVGGGVSAGQVALRLLAEGHHVSLVARHPLRQRQFDSDSGWLGPRYMTRFSNECNLEKRRSMIIDARHRGSMPRDIRRALRRAIDRGRIHWHETDVDSLAPFGDRVNLHLATGEDVDVDRVLLATGFRHPRPGGRLVDDLMEAESLPYAPCGYPVTDAALRWHPRVYVTGALAELELGPVARNIAGARRAADRVIAVLRGD